MARAEDRHAEQRARNDPRVEDRAGRPRVVAVVECVLGTVGIRRPQTKRRPVGAVHVFPAVVEDPAIGHDRRARIIEIVATDLADVGAVGVHDEQVGLDVPVAAAVFDVARAGEHDLAVGQVGGIDVRVGCAVRELPQLRTVGVHLADVIAVLCVAPHREHEPPAVVVHIEIPQLAVRDLQQLLHLAAAAQVQRLDRRARTEVRCADFARLEIRARVVVIRRVLPPLDEHEGRPTDQRVRDQRLALQLAECRADSIRAR